MTTLADLRARLRMSLNDNTAVNHLWNDDTLDLHINNAIRDYSRSYPRERQTTVDTLAGQAEYDLPADCLAVVRVESVAAPLLPGRDGGPGYELYGEKIVLSPVPTESGLSLLVRYLAPHAALDADTDLSTVPGGDEDLLMRFACAEAIQGLSAEEAKRQRFEERAGQAATSIAALYRQQYERGIRDRGRGVRTRRLVWM